MQLDMTLRDAGETIGLFEPLMVSEGSPKRAELNDLALELAARSAAFQASLPASIADALAGLIRSMNCYYSNLIEGHNTHPVDIERAMKDDYSADPEKRDLQLEAKAHIAVQKWIDVGVPPRLTPSSTCIAASVNCCRQIYCSWNTRRRGTGSLSFPGQSAITMLRLVVMWQSARALCTGS